MRVLRSLLIAALALAACAAGPTPNGGSYYTPINGIGCGFPTQGASGGAVGNLSANPLPDFMYQSGGTNNTFIASQAPSAYTSFPGFLTTKVKSMGACSGPALLVALDTQASSEVQGQFAIINAQNLSVLTAPTNIGPASTDGATCGFHDCSEVILGWDGSGLMTNLAHQVYTEAAGGAHYPAMRCMATTGLAGSTEACQPTYYVTDTGTVTDGLMAANFSEVTGAQSCYTVGCLGVVGGQVQASFPGMGVKAGQQDFVVMRITGDGATGVQFDNQCGQVQTITTGFNGPYNTGTADTAVCNAAYVPNDMPYSDYVGQVEITTNPTGTFTFNPPGFAACSSAVSVTNGASGQATASNAVSAYNAARGSTCPSGVTAYLTTSAASVFNGANHCSNSTIGCIGFGTSTGDPVTTSTSGSANCTGGGVVCSSWVQIQSPSSPPQALTHFLFGGLRGGASVAYRNCPNCFIQAVGVQYDTTTYNGTASNGPNIAFALFRIEPLAPGPGVEICAVDGTNCQDVILGSTPQTDYRKLGSGGGGTCASNGLSDCTEPGQASISSWCTTTPAGHGIGTCDTGANNPFLIRPCTNTVTNFPASGTPPFLYDWSYTAQEGIAHTTAGANIDLNFTPGNVWLFFAAQNGAVSPIQAIMYLDVNTSNRQTTCGFVAQSSDGSYRNDTLSAATGLSGKMYVTVGIPDAAAWTTDPNCSTGSATGLCLVQYTASPPYTSWTPTILQTFTGTLASSAALSVIFDDEYAMHVYDLYLSGSPSGCTQGTTCPITGIQDHYIP